MMPPNRSYDVFILGRGTKLSLIAQAIIQPQPTATVTHDTQLFLSKIITKTSDKTCYDITIAEKMNCIKDKIQKDLLTYGISCLPFYFYNQFPKLHSDIGQCKYDTDWSREIYSVRNRYRTRNKRLYVIE